MATATPAVPIAADAPAAAKLNNSVLQEAAVWLESEISRVSMLQQAAAAIRSIGSLSQAAQEAQARLDTLVSTHASLTAHVAQLEKDGETIINEAKQHAEDLKNDAKKVINVAQEEAEKVKTAAITEANSITAKAHADIEHIKTGLSGQVEALKAEVQQHTTLLNDVKAAHTLASAALNDVKSEYEAIKAKLLG